MADSLKSEHERLVRVAKEKAKEKVMKAIFEKKKTIKALEKEKADWRLLRR